MSVQSNTYILVGVMLADNPFGNGDDAYERTDPYRDSAYEGIQHHNGLCVIDDPMAGNFFAIGRVLAKTDDQNGNYGFNDPIDLSAAMTPELQAEVTSLIQQQFDIAPDVRLWTFTNYR